MKKLIIDRKTWLRGADADDGINSFLFRTYDGKRCCLGFYGNQHAGKSDHDMADVQAPQLCVVGDEWGPLVRVSDMTQPRALRAEQTLVCVHLVSANDDRDLDESSREERVTELFSIIGIEVEFIN